MFKPTSLLATMFTRATEWSHKQLSSNQSIRGWATATVASSSSLRQRPVQVMVAGTLDYDNVHTSHSSVQNAHKLCVPSVVIVDIQDGPVTLVLLKSSEATRVSVATTPVACLHCGPCESSHNASCFRYSWGRPHSHRGTTEGSGWPGRIPTGIRGSGF